MNDPVLYHYTNWASLLGILELGGFRATDWRMLNDSMEYRLGRDVLNGVIDGHRKSTHLRGIRAAIAKVESGSIEGSDSIFVVSFSEADDDLSQWRSYASDGQGVAIGIRQTVLKATKLTLKVVKYDADMHRASLQALLVRQLLLPSDAAAVRTQAKTLIRACMAYKHEGFAGEREHRLVSTVRSNVKFRASDRAMVPYREVMIPRVDSHDGSSPLAIAEIIVGPRAHLAAEETLRTYLWRWPVRPTLKRSKIPYQ